MADVVVGYDSGTSTLIATEGANLSKDSAVDLPVGATVVAADVAVLTPAPSRPFKGRYLLVRLNENAGTPAAASVTPLAGVTGQTPANQAARGDGDAIALDANDDLVVQLELSRYLQADGTVRLDVTSGSVSVGWVQLSKGAA